MRSVRAPDRGHGPAIRASRVVAAALLLASGCGAGPVAAPGAARRADARADDRAADEARLACGRVDAHSLPVRSRLDLERMTTEGGYAEVFESEGEIVEISGGLLGETFRFMFDYRYREGELVCATETVTTLYTISQSWPEGPQPEWRFDMLFFDGPRLVSRVTERAPRDTPPHHPPDEVRAFAARLFEMAAVEGEARRSAEARAD